MATKQLTGMEAVEAHLAALPQPQQATLRTVRAHLRALLPNADEGLSYNMPAFIVNGVLVASYEGFTRHCSYFPCSGSTLASIGPLKGGTLVGKGTLQFPVDKPLPLATIRRLVKARLEEMSKPAKSGKRFDYYGDGTVKAEGSVKDGQLHGKWKWYRQDGTLLRTGQFRAGEPTGVWETWDRDGRLVKSTTR